MKYTALMAVLALALTQQAMASEKCHEAVAMTGIAVEAKAAGYTLPDVNKMLAEYAKRNGEAARQALPIAAENAQSLFDDPKVTPEALGNHTVIQCG